MHSTTEIMCLVCLQVEEVMVYIYDEVEDLHTNLSDLLERCGDFRVNKDDKLPKYLCKECTSELLIAAKFREKCDHARQFLKQWQTFVEEDPAKHYLEETTDPCDIIETVETEEEDFVVEEEGAEELLLEIVSDQESAVDMPEVAHSQTISTTPVDVYDLPNIPEEAHFFDEETDEQIEVVISTEETVTEESGSASQSDGHMEGGKADNVNKSFKVRTGQKFVCDVCGAAFIYAPNLQRHFQRTHAPEQYFICERCQHCFSQEPKYSQHCRTCSYGEGRTTFANEVNSSKKKRRDALDAIPGNHSNNNKCEYCGKEVKTPFALRMHLRTHTGERPYACDQCEKSFKTQSALTVHLKRHSGQADFTCTTCGKAFYEQSNLKAHMLIHTGERPHICAVCKKRFSRVFLLQLHVRTHTGEKPYNCSHCNKDFRQKADLRSHLIVHSGLRQYTCSICPKAYIKRSRLVQHMRKHAALGISLEDEDARSFTERVEELEGGTANATESRIES